MRFALALAFFLAAAPLMAQNTDIEALSGLQFNFGNPGARSLGMGGAFIGLADDASAAEANPAGLTTLRRLEGSAEIRDVTISQRFVTGGTFPYVTVADFPSREKSVSFASVVVPTSAAVFAAYYHRPLSFRNRIDASSRFATPVFYLGPNGPVSPAECGAGCTEHRIYPFSTAANLQVETFGFAAASKWKTLSFGAAVRVHAFEETADTFRRDLDAPGQPVFTVAQTNAGQLFGRGTDRDVTFVGGLRWSPATSFSVGAVYKKGPTFPAAIEAAEGPGLPMTMIASTSFHVPTVAGIGVSYRPASQLTINADVVRLGYAKLTDDFVSVMEYGTENGGTIEEVRGYKTSDGTEIHAGLEYFVLTRWPVGIRAGWWRDPAHAIEYEGPMRTSHGVAARILFPGTESEDHFAVGIGIALPRMGVDVAYDTSRSLRTASVSMIVRR